MSMGSDVNPDNEPTAAKTFIQDNDYEIALDAVDFQISRHRSILYANQKAGDHAGVRSRRLAIANLQDVRRLLDPTDPVTGAIARKLIRSYRADL